MFNIQFEIFIFIADYKDVTPDNPGSDIQPGPGVMEDLSIGVEGMGDISGDPAAKIWPQAILASSCLSIHIFLFSDFLNSFLTMTIMLICIFLNAMVPLAT